MKKIMIIYHFFHPDDVVSARLFSDFAVELSKRNYQVTVLTSNRYCRYPERKIEKLCENWRSINIIRAKRPAFNQASNFARLINSFILITKWLFISLRMPKFDIIIVGTDPQFVAIIFPFFRLFNRGKLLCHWCYDLYPEAIEAYLSGSRLFKKLCNLLQKVSTVPL